MNDRDLLRTAADRLDALAARTTPGDWRTAGLLATRPEVIAHREGRTEHVAEARSGTAGLDQRPVAGSGAVAGRVAAGGRGCAVGGAGGDGARPDPAQRLP